LPGGTTKHFKPALKVENNDGAFEQMGRVKLQWDLGIRDVINTLGMQLLSGRDFDADRQQRTHEERHRSMNLSAFNGGGRGPLGKTYRAV